jgi:hypothetical protein|nr:MAG TPA: hypothetical protein [Caudoviricetes sp.]
MITRSTPALLQFYKDWLEAAEAPDADSDNHLIFRNGMGLCGNLEMWCDEYYDEEASVANAAYCCMKGQFEDAGLNSIYPFGERAYDVAAYHDTQHKDEKRLAWVKARIADMEDK